MGDQERVTGDSFDALVAGFGQLSFGWYGSSTHIRHRISADTEAPDDRNRAEDLVSITVDENNAGLVVLPLAGDEHGAMEVAPPHSGF